MDVRTLARLSAVQALYENEANGILNKTDGYDFVDKARQMAMFNEFSRINKKIFEQILTIVSRETSAIDDKIKANLADDWSIERIGGVLRAILRAAIGEQMSSETPKSVLIAEYVGITAGFYDDKEVRFVNAILDKVLV